MWASYGQLHLLPSHRGSLPAGSHIELYQSGLWLIEFQFTGLIIVALLHCSVVFAWIAALNRRRPVLLKQRAGHHAVSEVCYLELMYHWSSCWTNAALALSPFLLLNLQWSCCSFIGWGKYYNRIYQRYDNTAAYLVKGWLYSPQIAFKTPGIMFSDLYM